MVYSRHAVCFIKDQCPATKKTILRHRSKSAENKSLTVKSENLKRDVNRAGFHSPDKCHSEEGKWLKLHFCPHSLAHCRLFYKNDIWALQQSFISIQNQFHENPIKNGPRWTGCERRWLALWGCTTHQPAYRNFQLL